MANLIPWAEFETRYSEGLKGDGEGPLEKSARVALGSLLTKERLGNSDRETVEQNRENPYLQAVIGFKKYIDKTPFHPMLFVYFRNRITKDMVVEINDAIALRKNRKSLNQPKKKMTLTIGVNPQKPKGNYW